MRFAYGPPIRQAFLLSCSNKEHLLFAVFEFVILVLYSAARCLSLWGCVRNSLFFSMMNNEMPNKQFLDSPSSSSTTRPDSRATMSFWYQRLRREFAAQSLINVVPAIILCSCPFDSLFKKGIQSTFNIEFNHTNYLDLQNFPRARRRLAQQEAMDDGSAGFHVPE